MVLSQWQMLFGPCKNGGDLISVIPPMNSCSFNNQTQRKLLQILYVHMCNDVYGDHKMHDELPSKNCCCGVCTCSTYTLKLYSPLTLTIHSPLQLPELYPLSEHKHSR